MSSFQCLLGFSTRCDQAATPDSSDQQMFQCLLGFSTRCDPTHRQDARPRGNSFNAFSAFRPAVTFLHLGVVCALRSFNAFSAFRPAVTAVPVLADGGWSSFQCLLGFSTRCDTQPSLYGSSRTACFNAFSAFRPAVTSGPSPQQNPRSSCFNAFSAFRPAVTNRWTAGWSAETTVSMPSRLFDPL